METASSRLGDKEEGDGLPQKFQPKHLGVGEDQGRLGPLKFGRQGALLGRVAGGRVGYRSAVKSVDGDVSSCVFGIWVTLVL